MTTLELARGRRLESEEELAEVVRAMRTVAVLGMKDEAHADEAAYAIPAMLQARGLRVVPVNPRIETALGERAFDRIAEVPVRVDVVDVFRRSSNVPNHVDEIVALPPERRPRVVWLQSGIRHDEATERLLAVGIDVVSDRCLGVYTSRYG